MNFYTRRQSDERQVTLPEPHLGQLRGISERQLKLQDVQRQRIICLYWANFFRHGKPSSDAAGSAALLTEDRSPTTPAAPAFLPKTTDTATPPIEAANVNKNRRLACQVADFFMTSVSSCLCFARY